MKTKGVILIILSSTCLVPLFIILGWLIGDNLFYHLNAVLVEYKENYFMNVEIPQNVTVYFVGNVDGLGKDLYDITRLKYKTKTIGLYIPRDKDIFILQDLPDDEKKEYLIHELAHYDYDEMLLESEKFAIKQRYKLFCRNPNEFYAYTVQNYRYFRYE